MCVTLSTGTILCIIFLIFLWFLLQQQIKGFLPNFTEQALGSNCHSLKLSLEVGVQNECPFFYQYCFTSLLTKNVFLPLSYVLCYHLVVSELSLSLS